MVSQPIWIAIVFGVFFVGIGVSYAHFVNTYDPMSMKFQNQELFDEMMSNNPKMSQQWMGSEMMNPQQTMNDSQMQQQMMDMMLTDSDTMQKMILSTMQDSDQMTMMEDMMKVMMNKMQDDPKLKQAMIEHMDRMKASKEDMMGTMDNQMMNGMTSLNTENIISDLYNKDLNPSQIEYPNIVGFNDLHIEAIRHLAPQGDDSKLDVIVHHHCKVYDDMTATCLLFPTGMGDQDKPYGIEYIITSDQFTELSEDEKKYWHHHLTELPRAQATFPDLTDEELAPLQPIVDETYGKVFYFWDTDDKYPIGEPEVLMIQDLPE